MNLLSRVAALALAVALSSTSGGIRAAGKPFDQLLPEGATAFLSIRDIAAAQKWLETSPFSEVWKSREVEDLWKEAALAIEKSMQESKEEDKEMSKAFLDVTRSLRGEVAVAFGDIAKFDPSEKGEIPVVILADVSADPEKAKAFVSKYVTNAREKQGLRTREDEFRGTRFTILDSDKAAKGDDGDDKKADESSRHYLVNDGGLLMLCGSRPMLQDILANRTETAVKPLAEESEYRSSRDRIGKDAALVAYLNAAKLIAAIPKIAAAAGGPSGAQSAAIVPGVLGILGLANLKTVFVSSTLGKDEISQDIFVSLSGGPPRGILRAFWTKPRALRFPSVIPDDVAACTLVQIDAEALWDSIEGIARFAARMMPGAEPGAEGPKDPIAMAEQQLGIKFKQDLFAPMGGQFIEYSRVRKPYDESSAQMALLLELKDKEKFQTTLDKLVAMVPIVKKKDYLGRALYTFATGGDDSGDSGDGGKDASAPGLALAVTDTHLVLGVPTGLAEESIRRVGKEVKSVNDAPGFKAVAGRFPAEAIFIGYQNTDTIEYLFEMVKKAASSDGPLSDDGDGDGAGDASKAAHGLSSVLKKLPPVGLLTKTIQGFVSYGTTDERGLTATSKVILRRKE